MKNKLNLTIWQLILYYNVVALMGCVFISVRFIYLHTSVQTVQMRFLIFLITTEQKTVWNFSLMCMRWRVNYLNTSVCGICINCNEGVYYLMKKKNIIGTMIITNIILYKNVRNFVIITCKASIVSIYEKNLVRIFFFINTKRIDLCMYTFSYSVIVAKQYINIIDKIPRASKFNKTNSTL